MGLLMGGGGHFVQRNDVAVVATPEATETWRPVSHIDVIEAVENVLKARKWEIQEEQFGLARGGDRLFGVMQITSSRNPEWSRCIGIRNSHDKSFSVGLSAGINVMVCSNLAFGGTTVIRRKHTSRIDLEMLVNRAVDSLVAEFDVLENSCNRLKYLDAGSPDEVRALVVRAAEMGVINSSDIVPVFQEFRSPRHEEFAANTRWSLLNAFTEIVKKYTPMRVERTYQVLNQAFGLDGGVPELWPDDTPDGGHIEDIIAENGEL